MATNTDNNRGSFNNSIPSAPYNFVRLNDAVVIPPIAKVLSDVDLAQSFKEYVGKKDRISGYFEIEVENKTPLYIDGAEGFFSDGKNLCIPGSTMRGCIKNLFKIITCSAFRSDKNNPDISDKHLYYRSFASGFKPLRNLYSGKMSQMVRLKSGKTSIKAVAKAGFIVKEGKKYYICPCIRAFERLKPSYKDNTVQWAQDHVDVFTGRMQNKKHFYRLYAPDWKKKLVIPEEIINDYLDDRNRKGINVLNAKGCKKGPDGSALLSGASGYSYIYPCFYKATNDVVDHFGSGPYYRIPYDKSISQHIPSAVNTNAIDFTDAVFGRKEDWASRIFFEDLYLAKDDGRRLPERCRKILGTPNPTSFQFYLNSKGKDAAHWDGDTDIRGYKMYWHSQVDWFTLEKPKNSEFVKEIAPLPIGHVFKGRIRFEGLDAIELGALCALFNLAAKDDICLKIGMGKSIGMGTAKLKAVLHRRQKEYYTTLFDTEGFAECLAASSEQDMHSLEEGFKKYLHQNFVGRQALNYKERMIELSMILSTKHMETYKEKWSEAIRYMNVTDKNDSKAKNTMNKRIVLPDINKVVENLRK